MQQPRINQQIRARELRVIGPKGENLGVITLEEALKRTEDLGLDLIEISATTTPPVAKIADFGKYIYEENKKSKQSKKTSEWLSVGNRVKVDLFLPGRAKYLDEKFLKERIERMLKFVTVDYKIADPAKKSPKGMTVIIERA